MKKTLFLIVLSLCCLPLAAQHRVIGRVVDAKGNKIPYATVILQHPDSSVVAGCIADSLGMVSMANIPSGSYILSVSFVGYEAVCRNIDAPAQREVGGDGQRQQYLCHGQEGYRLHRRAPLAGCQAGNGVNILDGLTTISPALDGVASSSMMREEQ